jgi:hypothetical protein
MCLPLFCTVRLAAVACLLLSIAPVPQGASVESADAGARAAVEVRLRKLHLVRPDLIPYPIAYEVCC